MMLKSLGDAVACERGICSRTFRAVWVIDHAAMCL